MTFGQVVKTINSDWDWDLSGCSMDKSGNKYERYYIKSGYGRRPTIPECLAIADYLGMVFKKGYFYKKII